MSRFLKPAVSVLLAAGCGAVTERPSDAGPADAASVDAEGGADAAVDAAPPSHRVFITSIVFQPNFGGLTGGDAQCQARASAVGLPGTFKALLSDSTASVTTRITISGPVFNMAGAMVAADSLDFFDGVALAANNIDETGDAPLDTVAWVGSSADHCSNWSVVAALNGQQALVTQLSTWLFGNSTGPCSLSRSLQCISQ